MLEYFAVSSLHPDGPTFQLQATYLHYTCEVRGRNLLFRDKDSKQVKCYTMNLPIIGLCDSPFAGRPYFLLTSGELGRILGIGDGFCRYDAWKWKLGSVLGFEPVVE